MKRFPGRVFRGMCWASALLPVAVLTLLAGFLVRKGGGTLSLELFFGDVPVWKGLTGRVPVWEGIWPACVGTLSVVAIASVLAIPVGICAGIYISEYAQGWWKAVLSFWVDLLAGIPSILMGLFGFALILFLRRTFLPQANICLLLSGVCMAMLILPYMVNTTLASLEGIPEHFRLMGPSLGMTRLSTLLHILLPAEGQGILGGTVLAMGRAAEDTAVILMTGVVANAGLPRSLLDSYEALPFKIFTTAAEYRNPEELSQGFGTALVLLVLTTLVFMAAHALHWSMNRRWKGVR